MNDTLESKYIDLEDTFGVRLGYVIISCFGSIFQALNLFVLSSKKLKDSSYKYMFANSLNNLLYFLLVMLFHIYFIITLIHQKKSLLFLICQIAILEYLTSCMAIFNLIVQILLSIQRILMILNKQLFQNLSPYRGIIVITIFSLFYYIPVLTIQKIELASLTNMTTNHTNHGYEQNYAIVSTEFGKTSFGKSIRTILSIGRIVLATVVLSIVNIVNYYLFRKFFDKKVNLTKKRAELSKFFLNSMFDLKFFNL